METDWVQISTEDSGSDALFEVSLSLIRSISSTMGTGTNLQDLCEEITEFPNSVIHRNYMLLNFLRAFDSKEVRKRKVSPYLLIDVASDI